MANKKKRAKKKTVDEFEETPEVQPEAPPMVKVYFVAEEVRAFLLEYLQTSPAGSYAPATINNVCQALRDAGSGQLAKEQPDEG